MYALAAMKTKWILGNIQVLWSEAHSKIPPNSQKTINVERVFNDQKPKIDKCPLHMPMKPNYLH